MQAHVRASGCNHLPSEVSNELLAHARARAPLTGCSAQGHALELQHRRQERPGSRAAVASMPSVPSVPDSSSSRSSHRSFCSLSLFPLPSPCPDIAIPQHLPLAPANQIRGLGLDGQNYETCFLWRSVGSGCPGNGVVFSTRVIHVFRSPPAASLHGGWRCPFASPPRPPPLLSAEGRGSHWQSPRQRPALTRLGRTRTRLSCTRRGEKTSW